MNLNETGKQSLHTGFVFCWCMQVLSKLSFAFLPLCKNVKTQAVTFQEMQPVSCIKYSYTDLQDKLEK